MSNAKNLRFAREAGRKCNIKQVVKYGFWPHCEIRHIRSGQSAGIKGRGRLSSRFVGNVPWFYMYCMDARCFFIYDWLLSFETANIKQVMINIDLTPMFHLWVNHAL